MASLIPDDDSLPVREIPCPASVAELIDVLGVGPTVLVLTDPEGATWWMEEDGLGYNLNRRAGNWIRDRIPDGWYHGPVLYLSPAETAAHEWVKSFQVVYPTSRRRKAMGPPGMVRLQGNITPVRDRLKVECGVVWDENSRAWWCPPAKLQQAHAIVGRSPP